MLGLIQLVSEASVTVNDQTIARIDRGILALIGIEKKDTEQIADRLIERILNYRIFPDKEGKMNVSLTNIGEGLLLVPQFTLVAETNKGTRPGFSLGMPPNEGAKLFSYIVTVAQKAHPIVVSGQFAAHMMVSLCNDGPVTFILQTK